MLRFQDTPNAKSLAILHAALDDALNWLDCDRDFPEDFSISYPKSSKCFTPELAEHTLKALLRASKDSALYQLTDYHWLLLYEVLWNFTTVFNDEPELAARKELNTQYGIQEIDFFEFIDLYFWDIDFLTNPNDVINMGEESRKVMDFSPEAYGVIQRWAPHPEELELKKVSSVENPFE